MQKYFALGSDVADGSFTTGSAGPLVRKCPLCVNTDPNSGLWDLSRCATSRHTQCSKRNGYSITSSARADDKIAKKPFKRYPIGYFHLDIAEVRTEEGKLYLFAIDRTSKFVFAQLHEAANVKSAVGFLQALIEAVPYAIHIVLTDNGIQFGDMPSRRTGPTARYRLHMFDRICREHGIEHRLTKPNHPWTNGQVERMNRVTEEIRAVVETVWPELISKLPPKP